MTTETAQANTVTIDLDRNYTLEEFLNLELPDDNFEYELIGGKLVARPKSGVSAEHGLIVGRLMQHLNNHIDANPVGLAYDQVSCTLGRTDPNASYVEPDVSFVSKQRITERFKGSIPVAPDLIAEVWSPTDETQKIQDKVDEYQLAGVRLIWSVYMVSKYVVVNQLGESKRILLDLDDELDGLDVIPGFKLKVSRLFE